MPEAFARSSVDQIVQIGVEAEATPGTQVAATRRLPSMSFDVKPMVEVETFRAAGFNVDTVSVIQKEWANGGYTGPGDYNHVVYPLSGLIGMAGTSPVQQGADPAYLWAFHPVSQGADPHSRTFTLEEGDAIAARISTLLRFQSWKMAFNNTTVTNDGNLFCRLPVDDEALTSSVTTNDIQKLVVDAGGGTYTLSWNGQGPTIAIAYNASAAVVRDALINLTNIGADDLTVTGGPGDAGGTTPYFIEFIGALAAIDQPEITSDATLLTGGASTATITDFQDGGVASGISLVPQRPVSRRQIDIFIDNTFGGIGTTKVAAAYEGEIAVGNKFDPFWVLNTDYPSFADSVRIPAQVTAFFSTSANAQARALYNSIASNPVRYVRWLATGLAIGASGEKIQIDAAVRFAQPEVIRDAAGVFGYKFGFNSMHDASMGGAYQVDVINGLSSLG